MKPHMHNCCVIAGSGRQVGRRRHNHVSCHTDCVLVVQQPQAIVRLTGVIYRHEKLRTLVGVYLLQSTCISIFMSLRVARLL